MFEAATEQTEPLLELDDVLNFPSLNTTPMTSEAGTEVDRTNQQRSCADREADDSPTESIDDEMLIARQPDVTSAKPVRKIIKGLNIKF